MLKNSIDKLIGQYCKIVIKEPGLKKATVIFGLLKDFGQKEDFIIIESSEGLGFINKKSIIAIKPSKRKRIDSKN